MVAISKALAATSKALAATSKALTASSISAAAWTNLSVEGNSILSTSHVDWKTNKELLYPPTERRYLDKNGCHRPDTMISTDFVWAGAGTSFNVPTWSKPMKQKLQPKRKGFRS